MFPLKLNRIIFLSVIVLQMAGCDKPLVVGSDKPLDEPLVVGSDKPLRRCRTMPKIRPEEPLHSAFPKAAYPDDQGDSPPRDCSKP